MFLAGIAKLTLKEKVQPSVGKDNWFEKVESDDKMNYETVLRLISTQTTDLRSVIESLKQKLDTLTSSNTVTEQQQEIAATVCCNETLDNY